MRSAFVRRLATAAAVVVFAATSLGAVLMPRAPACQKMGADCGQAAFAALCCCPEHTPATSAPSTAATTLSQITRYHWSAVSSIDDLIVGRIDAGFAVRVPVPGCASPPLQLDPSNRLTTLLI